MSDNLRIVVVDDHPMFREGVVHSLESQPDMEVVGQGASAEEGIRLVQQLLPDVALLDISIPGGGVEAARAISTSCPVVKIVMLTASENEDHVVSALEAGARAYVLKGVSTREMTSVVRSVHAGEVYVTPALAAHLLATRTVAAAKPKLPVDPMNQLTEREQQILELVASGHSNKEIGRRLFLTEKTVKHYMTNILQKLQVRNRVEAALLAQKAGRGQTG
jgi:two-component system, NarL family, nitrate/nitrite response regulator NarL